MLHIDLQYFPCIFSLHAIQKNTLVCFNEHLPFCKSTFRNRAILPGANGLIQLSIPVVGGRDIKLPYKDVLIDHSVNWQRDHFRTISSIYGKSAWGLHYFDALEMLFSKKEKYLFDWNMNCLMWLNSKLKINMQIIGNNICENNDQIINFTDKVRPSNYQLNQFRNSKYFQVFEEKTGFQYNVSGLDLLMNEGPSSVHKILSDCA